MDTLTLVIFKNLATMALINCLFLSICDGNGLEGAPAAGWAPPVLKMWTLELICSNNKQGKFFKHDFIPILKVKNK